MREKKKRHRSVRNEKREELQRSAGVRLCDLRKGGLARSAAADLPPGVIHYSSDGETFSSVKQKTLKSRAA